LVAGEYIATESELETGIFVKKAEDPNLSQTKWSRSTHVLYRHRGECTIMGACLTSGNRSREKHIGSDLQNFVPAF
jgi:hypothetical protein